MEVPMGFLFLFVSRFRKNKGRIVLVLRLSALPPPCHSSFAFFITLKKSEGLITLGV